MNSTYQICTKSVMDNSADPDISFDENGICNYWRETVPRWESLRFTKEESERILDEMFAKVRESGAGREYDSILGLSGGVDSSYLTFLARQYNLRPLIVHFDNGWNSELAVINIQQMLEKLGYDLKTYVINWTEFRDLQRAFIKAGVIDVEMLTDHGIFAALFHLAKQHKLRYILSGVNVATESFLPPTWTWSKLDLRNLRAIHRRFGEVKLKTFPTLSNFRFLTHQRLTHQFQFIAPLNYCNYRKDTAIETLTQFAGWRYYGGKHYESVFTKFYQAHMLPTKFGVDKRRAHLSSLIMNEEITREEALLELEKPLYSPEALEADMEYVCKKLGFSHDEMEAYLKRPPVPHAVYPNDRAIMATVTKIWQSIKPIYQRS